MQNEDVSADGWPLVVKDDDGIRPAGPSDACFYCGQNVGQPHARNCGVVTKTVTVRYVFEIPIVVPYAWDKAMIEFHRNENTWCADNALEELEVFAQDPDADSGPCLCERFTCEVVSDADATPHRKRRYHHG